MKWFSLKTFLEIFTQTFVNVTAAYFTVALVSPGIFGISSLSLYFDILIKNVPFGIFGLVFCSALSEKTKSL